MYLFIFYVEWYTGLGTVCCDINILLLLEEVTAKWSYPLGDVRSFSSQQKSFLVNLCSILVQRLVHFSSQSFRWYLNETWFFCSVVSTGWISPLQLYVYSATGFAGIDSEVKLYCHIFCCLAGISCFQLLLARLL